MTTEKLTIGMAYAHPGQFIRTEILDELDLTITRAAELLGVRAATISDLVNEHARLSPEMAVRLELAFEVKADLLLRMQALYDLQAARSRAGELGVQPYRQAAQ